MTGRVLPRSVSALRSTPPAGAHPPGSPRHRRSARFSHTPRGRGMAGTVDVELAATNAVTLAVTTAYGPANGHRLLDPRGGLVHDCQRRPDAHYLRHVRYTSHMDLDAALAVIGR